MMTKLAILGVMFAVLLSQQASANAELKACEAGEIADMVELGVDDAIHLQCNLNLAASDTIKAHLVLQGTESSGVQIDCGGGTLFKVTIRSSHRRDAYDDDEPSESAVDDEIAGLLSELRKDLVEEGLVGEVEGSDREIRHSWYPVTDVAIRHCTVLGPLQITGMGPTAHPPQFVWASSHRDDHVERVRAAAPTRIILDDLVLVGGGTTLPFADSAPWLVKGWTPLFIGPGVSYLSLTNSELKGISPGPGLYLDSESHHNTIESNYIHVDTKRTDFLGRNKFREQIAVDNSSSNIIINNSFAALLGGGVHLYRNCGENGAVRRTRPQHNHIVNNFFYYSSGFDKKSPAIFVGSRDGTKRDYCDEDDMYARRGNDDAFWRAGTDLELLQSCLGTASTIDYQRLVND